MGLGAGVDGFCAGTPEEALRIRACAPASVVLLFTACIPENLPRLAQQGVIVSVNSVEAFATLARSGIACGIYLDLDCGFGRFGLDETALNDVLDLAALHPAIAIEGAYTHFGQGNAAALDWGLTLFERHLDRLRQRIDHPLTTMVAATHTILSRPALPYDAVDPGRLLYGIVDKDAQDRFRPVLSAISSRLIQVNRIAEAQTVTIGYGEQVALPAGGTTGVFPLGWHDSLSLRGPLGDVLIHGRRVPVIARTLLHSVVDVSGLDDVRIGDEVALVGVQGAAALTLNDQAVGQGVTTTELHFRLAGAITRAAPFPTWQGP
jgi:alanine racemase